MKRYALFLLFLLPVIVIADNRKNVEFFVSNNTQSITLDMAYERLIGKEQFILEDNIIDVMQENHVDQGRFENIIGTYQMLNAHDATADNVALFTTSPFENITREKIFLVARQSAIRCHQESVAVFIPSSHRVIRNIIVSFELHPRSMKDVVQIIRKRLPQMYQSFSMHLDKGSLKTQDLKVTEVEWLGSQLAVSAVQKNFPNDKIFYRYGNAYLVYQDGRKKEL